MIEREIFTAALNKPDPAKRSAYLCDVCREDAGLRQRVESLLADHEQLGSFLEMPSPTSAATIDRALNAGDREGPGTLIGPYKLLQQIGEGGMGAVYMAEQREPVERRVALKIIKPGMDTKQVIARFEAERQALALMDHPNVARVLDAGTTQSGRPYFVMELVKGVPITQYCDAHQLSPRQRLELFVPICQAVQHAHQKGIIHRDIKPTNILVAEYDQQAVPKVIDFGIAKAMSQRLTDRTMFTEFGQVVGTIEYMSPEQAKLNQLDIDTRSDIYSLGVLLYELLTGLTPFDRKRLHSAAFDEMLRIIREEEPPKPSTQISKTRNAQRLSRIEPSAASGSRAPHSALRIPNLHELDSIVMKCLEKDRSRRYETANNLVCDLERYLADEPVQARPPSTTYRLRKFAQRNKVAVAAGLLIAASLLLGTAISTWQAIRATAAERQSQANLQSLQQVARQWATSETLTGDPERAEAAIRLAEAANVSKAWTEILRAQADIDQGRPKDAAKRLTPITAGTYPNGDDDTQMAALSLLVYAQLQTGDSSALDRNVQRMREFRHDPGPEAGLFRAVTEFWIDLDPAKTVASLEAATKKRFYPASLLILAKVRSLGALHNKDHAMVLQAQKDLEFAEMFAGNSPSVLSAKLRVHGYGHKVAIMVGNSQAAETHLAELASCLPQLEKLPKSVLNNYHIAFAYARLNQWEKALEVERMADWGHSFYIQHAAAHLYERVADPRAALARFEQLKADENSPERLVARACFCAEIADKRGELPGLFKRVVAANPAFVVRCRALNIWALMGKPAELRDEARNILDHLGGATNRAGLDQALHYLAGDWDGQRALKEVSSSVTNQSTMHNFMGLERLACGDRDGARRHFEECLKTASFDAVNRGWAQARLARMDRDPNWPDWIEKQQ